jgi:hypothetical protein
MHFYKSNFPQEFIQQNYSKTNEHTTQEKGKKHFWQLGASCLETDMATIPQMNSSLYSVPTNFVVKFQKDVSIGKPLSTDRQTTMTTTDKQQLQR